MCQGWRTIICQLALVTTWAFNTGKDCLSRKTVIQYKVCCRQWFHEWPADNKTYTKYQAPLETGTTLYLKACHSKSAGYSTGSQPYFFYSPGSPTSYFSPENWCFFPECILLCNSMQVHPQLGDLGIEAEKGRFGDGSQQFIMSQCLLSEYPFWGGAISLVWRSITILALLQVTPEVWQF